MKAVYALITAGSVVTAGPFASVASAEVPSEPDPSAETGFSLMEEGAKIILRSLLDEIEPRMNSLQEGFEQAFADMEPAIRELLLKIDDFRNYQPPEMLPNGDIILRRKVPLSPRFPPVDGEIDL